MEHTQDIELRQTIEQSGGAQKRKTEHSDGTVVGSGAIISPHNASSKSSTEQTTKAFTLVSESHTAQTQEQENPLLKLPAEVRNSIYELVLVRNRILFIKRDSPKQPALTLTCRQIRQESLGIFYTKNQWRCDVKDYEATEFLRYLRIAKRHGLRSVEIAQVLKADSDVLVLKANLMKWLEGIFTDQPSGRKPHGSGDEDYDWNKIEDRFFKLVDMAKNLKQCTTSWEEAKNVLEPAVEVAGICGESNP